MELNMILGAIGIAALMYAIGLYLGRVAERLWDEVLVEISEAISESSLDEYASCGADALSMGALTHSPRALDLSLKIS